MSDTPKTPRRRLIATAAAAMACAAALAPGAQAAQVNCGTAADLQPTASNLAQINSATICLMNNERDARGLVKLNFNQALFNAAQKHTTDMVTKHFFSHTGSDGSTPSLRMKPYYTGSPSWAIAENIYWGGGSLATPRNTVKAWMNSAGHRANILDVRFRDVGVAAAAKTPSGGAGGTYTAAFGKH